jgi:hypothetical protein
VAELQQRGYDPDLRIGGIAADPQTSSHAVARGQGIMVFTLSGRMKAEEVAELKALFDADYRTIVLDLRDVRLADREAVTFLRDCEADGMQLENWRTVRRTSASGWKGKKIEGASN